MIDRKSTKLSNRTRMARVTRRGFTLVEVMGAVVIGALVSVTASTMLVQIEQTRHVAKKQVESRWRAEKIFETLERDIASAITWLPNPIIQIPNSENVLLEIVCLVTFNEPGQPLPRRLPARVVYSFDGKGSIDRRKLVRQIWNLTTNTDKPAYREVLASNLDLFSVRYFLNDKWSKRTELSNILPITVNAVELTCKWNDSPKGNMRLFVIRSNDA